MWLYRNACLWRCNCCCVGLVYIAVIILVCLNDREITFACLFGLNRLPGVHKNTISYKQLRGYACRRVYTYNIVLELELSLTALVLLVFIWSAVIWGRLVPFLCQIGVSIFNWPGVLVFWVSEKPEMEEFLMLHTSNSVLKSSPKTSISIIHLNANWWSVDFFA